MRSLPALLLLTIVGCSASMREDDGADPEIDVVTNTVETREESTQTATSDGGAPHRPIRPRLYYDQSTATWY